MFEWGSRRADLDHDDPYSHELLVQDVVLRPGAERLFQDYSGDLSGRYLQATADAGQLCQPSDEVKAHRILEAVLHAQNEDGSFGRDCGKLLDHGKAWGNGRLLAGLDRVCATGEQQVLARTAADRLARHLVEQLPAWLRWLDDDRNSAQKFCLDFYSCLLPLVERAEAPAGDDWEVIGPRGAAAAAAPAPRGTCTGTCWLCVGSSRSRTRLRTQHCSGTQRTVGRRSPPTFCYLTAECSKALEAPAISTPKAAASRTG
jgi:hypothetical protein